MELPDAEEAAVNMWKEFAAAPFDDMEYCSAIKHFRHYALAVLEEIGRQDAWLNALHDAAAQLRKELGDEDPRD